MARDLVLITGATGFLGYLTMIDLLKHGYRVRAAVRSMAKAEGILSAPTLKSLSPTQNSSPVLEKQFVSGCERDAIEILEAAATKSHGIVKRVELDLERVWTPNDRNIPPPPPYGSEVETYIAANKTAFLASEAFIRDQKPLFDLITIVPPWIWARDELLNDKDTMLRSGSNEVLLSLVTGKQFEFEMIGNAAHGIDVARAHVTALDPHVSGNRAYVINREIVWNDAITTAKTLYPEAFKDGRLKAGNCPSFVIKWDASITENELELIPRLLEPTVESVVGQYLELLEKEAAREH
ncbi:hypothetical protein GGI42DRAFT_362633 [Trichoderma sp. SZMC 28013]